jgi:DNA invertase Pin-like site-specific DNA recombinase
MNAMINVLLVRLSQDRAESESLDLQARNARSFAASKGWGTEETIVVSDVDSGAEIRKRPGVVQLLRLAAEHGDRMRIIARDLDRISRAGVMHTMWLFAELDTRGVSELWDYGSMKRIETRGGPAVYTAFDALRAEGEWDSNSKRRREALRARAQDGRPTRGPVYGFRTEGTGKNKRHVRDDEQITRLLHLAETFVATGSIRETTRRLNAEHMPSPGGTTWMPATVRNLLRRPYYRGVVVHGRTHTVRDGGSPHSVLAPASDVIRVEVPELRVFPLDLAHKIDTLLAAAPHHPPSGNRTPKHLCSSFLKCGECGGSLSAVRGSYVCVRSHQQGKAACRGVGERSERAVDAAVLATVRPYVAGEVTRRALAKLRRTLDERDRPQGREAEQARVQRELAVCRKAIDVLLAVVTRGGLSDAESPTICALRDHEGRHAALREALQRLDGPAPADLDARRLYERLRARLTELAELRDAEGVAARAILAAVLGRERFTVRPMEEQGQRRWDLRVDLPRGYLANVVSLPSASSPWCCAPCGSPSP